MVVVGWLVIGVALEFCEVFADCPLIRQCHTNWEDRSLLLEEDAESGAPSCEL